MARCFQASQTFATNSILMSRIWCAGCFRKSSVVCRREEVSCAGRLAHTSPLFLEHNLCVSASPNSRTDDRAQKSLLREGAGNVWYLLPSRVCTATSSAGSPFVASPVQPFSLTLDGSSELFSTTKPFPFMVFAFASYSMRPRLLSLVRNP